MSDLTRTIHPPHSPSTRTIGLALLFLTTLSLFIVRVTGPSNLLDSDQERPASYVMDVVLNGNWACQVDWTGDVMSKPPLFTWIGALATFPVGHANLISLYTPCLIAMLVTVGLIFLFGRQHFGPAAGLLAALMYLAAPSGIKHIALARTDLTFGATIALTALLGYRAWTTGRGWSWFWFAAALATLTKGPLGVVLASMGFLAVIWETLSARRAAKGARVPEHAEMPRPQATSHPRGHFWLSQLMGIALFLLIAGGWFWLAYRHSGQAFIDKVIGKELVGQMVSDEHGVFGIGFVKAPVYWLTRFFPWTVLAILGMVGVIIRPAADPRERRFERFLVCWIAGGLLLFSLATHQRGDLPLPLFAPAALLAGREVARWLKHWEFRKVAWLGAIGFAVFLGLHTVYLYAMWARTWPVRHSEAVASFAQELAGDPSLPPLLHVDSPYALQFHLNTMDLVVSVQEAATALKSDEPWAVAVQDVRRLRKAVGDAAVLYERGSCPGQREDRVITVLSNRPE